MTITPGGDPYYFHLPVYLSSGYTEAVHGSVLYPGKTDPGSPAYGYWCNISDKLELRITDFSSLAQINAIVYIWESTGFVQFGSQIVTPAAPTYTVNLTRSGYYAMSIADTNTTPGVSHICGAEFKINCDALAEQRNAQYFGQFPLPNIAAQFPAIGAGRTIAASLMFSNTTPNLQIGGNAVVSQVGGGEHWVDYASYDRLSNENPAVSQTFVAKKGAFAFLKPRDTRDLDMVLEYSTDTTSTGGDPNITYQNGLEDAYFLITSPTDFLAIALNMPAVQTGVDVIDARSGLWTAVWKIEYETSDQWRSLDKGFYSPEVIDTALATVNAAPQFHENPLHLKDIEEFLRGLARRGTALVQQYGPTAASMIGSLVKGANTLAPLLL